MHFPEALSPLTMRPIYSSRHNVFCILWTVIVFRKWRAISLSYYVHRNYTNIYISSFTCLYIRICWYMNIYIMFKVKEIIFLKYLCETYSEILVVHVIPFINICAPRHHHPLTTHSPHNFYALLSRTIIRHMYSWYKRRKQ